MGDRPTILSSKAALEKRKKKTLLSPYTRFHLKKGSLKRKQTGRDRSASRNKLFCPGKLVSKRYRPSEAKLKLTVTDTKGKNQVKVSEKRMKAQEKGGPKLLTNTTRSPITK